MPVGLCAHPANHTALVHSKGDGGSVAQDIVGSLGAQLRQTCVQSLVLSVAKDCCHKLLWSVLRFSLSYVCRQL